MGKIYTIDVEGISTGLAFSSYDGAKAYVEELATKDCGESPEWISNRHAQWPRPAGSIIAGKVYAHIYPHELIEK